MSLVSIIVMDPFLVGLCGEKKHNFASCPTLHASLF